MKEYLKLLKQMAEAIRDDKDIPKDGLIITYYLPPKKHYKLQEEIYRLYNPTLKGLEDKEYFDLYLLNVQFRFYKKNDK